ncbi:4Fe-4S ferredoxin, iron-sulfur binding domain protein [Magnetococcus marinus MC-1]|uniref:4Fe-4S ferredoxin, iron-sulfur binding domain protein n=1 Tax=Magnetococcus marinus (strain ATCC BAA-1437 / JCM 17883 / MC-1) TaxID=156889 RepID=A0LA59_MAGMM|nr:cytochrome c oxidase accessory protein CcoG [Magnetococcus marinus]ABK44852.1 4Fe-4S ferredoxin, iron-sulfur binding domain protein [Magnetococcus marinus MC-1]
MSGAAENESLYQDWKKLYPRYQKGFFRSIRWALLVITLGIYYLLPMLRWERAGNLPDQAVLFDLPARKFYIFDLIIWPQEIFLLSMLLFLAAIALFFVTSLAGRVFCGYFCFQTVWTDLFLLVEKLFEGNRKKRMKLDEGPWTAHKWAIKIAKHATWMLIGVLTGGVFVFYFADAPTLMGQFIDGTAPFPAWFTMGFLALTTYTMAGFAREQVCIYMCPYARFQGAMFDEDTIIIAYHNELGEPRESNRRVRQENPDQVGWCIDCNECVTVCPTGIDIRDGQQYQCITCGMCIDACDDVMASLAKEGEATPPRLIRYTSLVEIKGKKPRFLRTRTLVYLALMAIGIGAMAGYFMLREPTHLNVIKHRQPVYIMQSDGGVQNNYTIRILNMTTDTQRYTVSLTGLEGVSLKSDTADGYDGQGNPYFDVGSGKVVPHKLFVKQPRKLGKPGAQEIVFTMKAADASGGSSSYNSVFMRPE